MGLNILIADDSAFMRNYLKRALKQAQVAKIVEAKDGQEVVVKYKEEKPDLVFLDIMMPNKDGIDALKEIKKLVPDSNVIMCTSVGQEKIIKECVDAGANDFITKPFKPDEIVTVVKKYNE